MNQALNAHRDGRTWVDRDEKMDLTLLLDLDDTLLDSKVDDFIPAYFTALSGFLEDLINPELMLSALMSGTRKMVESNDPSQTLQQVFDSQFFPMIGIPRTTLQPRIDRFYKEVFPTLSYLTKPRPDAVALVDWALEQGFQVAVATNPLFPLAAIHHRMRWAGLPPEEIPFVVVSSYEEFHFSKPNPAYFGEVLGRMGWPEGPVVMVGDDCERDLVGSQILGLPAYWVNTADDVPPDGVDFAGRGSIGNFRPWLEKTDFSTLEPAFSSPEALIALMLSTPAAVAGILAALLKREQTINPDLTHRPASNEWSLTEIICHLRDTEAEINLPRVRMLLDLKEPFIPARVTDTWATERAYNKQSITQALQEFTAERMQMVNVLRGLTYEWRNKARHAIFGPTDLQELVKFMVEHDKLHIRQILSTLKQVTG